MKIKILSLLWRLLKSVINKGDGLFYLKKLYKKDKNSRDKQSYLIIYKT